LYLLFPVSQHKDASDEELDRLIDNAFQDVENEVHEQLVNMKHEVRPWPSG
jgi:hypothetical protein